MTGTAEQWPDVEGAVRTFLRADPGLQALIPMTVDGQPSARVYFSIPRKSVDAGVFPCVKVQRIGGGQDPGEAPVDLALIQLDVFGRLASEAGGGLGEARKVANAVRSVISRIRGETPLDNDVIGWDARVQTDMSSPMSAEDRPRYIISFAVTAIAKVGA